MDSGLNVVAGFDNDTTCKFTYETNNKVKFNHRNIREVKADEINNCYSENAFKILVGCAPCQPFSQMRFKMGKENNDDEKYDLLLEFGRLIKEVQPIIISMENVPYIRETSIFKKFLTIIKENGYFTNNNGEVVYCPNYGIPQNRRRFVLLASKLGTIELIPFTHNKKEVTVRQFIEELPVVEAGVECAVDPMHRTAKLSEINLKRIQASNQKLLINIQFLWA